MAKYSGVYAIIVNDDNYYIGSSTDIAKRWSVHLAHLRKGDHYYNLLQAAYSENTQNVKFEILEECETHELEEREQYWVDFFKKIDDVKVINIRTKIKRPTRVQDTTKMKLAQTGENNGHCCKLNAEKVRAIKQLLRDGVRKSEIARQYGLSVGFVCNIANGNRWASVD